MSAPLREANSSSWAARNPTRSIIRPRTPPPRLTDAQKASRKIKRDQRVERTKRLHDAVAEYLDEQKTKIEALSRAHHVTPKQVNDIIGSQTHYRTSRKSQLMHALIHAKAKEVNAGKSNNFLLNDITMLILRH
jgi:flagellar biosynthesis regulator FlaF